MLVHLSDDNTTKLTSRGIIHLYQSNFHQINFLLRHIVKRQESTYSQIALKTLNTKAADYTHFIAEVQQKEKVFNHS